MSQQVTDKRIFLLRKTGGVKVRDKETSFLLYTHLGSFLKYMHTVPLNKNNKNKNNTIKRGINSLYCSDILNKSESFYKIYFIWAISESNNKHSRYSNIYSCICILWPLQKPLPLCQSDKTGSIASKFRRQSDPVIFYFRQKKAQNKEHKRLAYLNHFFQSR